MPLTDAIAEALEHEHRQILAQQEDIYPQRYPVNEIVNLFINAPYDIGVLHYASDTPYSRRSSLLRRRRNVKPAEPDVIDRTNRDEFEGLPEGLLGALPQGAPALPVSTFRASAPAWLPGLVQRLGTP